MEIKTKFNVGDYVRVEAAAFDANGASPEQLPIIEKARNSFLGVMGRINGIHFHFKPGDAKIVYDVGIASPIWVELSFTESMLSSAKVEIQAEKGKENASKEEPKAGK